MDSEWLATLARAGLLKPSFIPPKDLRELRLIGRHRMKLHGMLAGEKNRLLCNDNYTSPSTTITLPHF